MQSIYSPNRLYLTFPSDNSNKIIKIYNFTQIYDFSSFLADLSYVKPFLSTVNKCTIAIMTIIINVKGFLERHFCSISMNNFWKWIYLCDKKAVLHATTLMHCDARQVLRNIFSTNGYPRKWLRNDICGRCY